MESIMLQLYNISVVIPIIIEINNGTIVYYLVLMQVNLTVCQ